MHRPSPAGARWRQAALLSATVLLAACASAPGSAPGGSGEVRLVRTTHGIPHITAPDLRQLAFGVAYAHAQDNVCQSADHLLTVRGQRSRWFGEQGQGILGVRALPNGVIDTFIAAHMDDAALAKAWQTASPVARDMAQGYVDGYNRFLADHAGKLPTPCGGQPWVQPMTLADYYRASEVVQVQAGVGALADAVAAAQPPQRTSRADELAPDAQQLAAWTVGGREALREAGIVDSPLGSNAWAFGRDTSANGRGVLLGNPHYPWVGTSRFWQMHLTVPGQLDIMGAALGWSPFVQIGFNKDVAWSHTVSTGKRFTLHELALVDGQPTSYLVDGKPEAMQQRTVRYPARQADGSVAEKTQTVWMTRFGPVMVLPRAGLNWTARTAYAIQDANAGSVRGSDTYLAMGKSTSVQDLQAALRGMGTSFVNTIAADRHGNALYADLSGVPDVDAALLARCAPSRPAAALLGSVLGVAVIDGSRAACNWNRDTASVAPGLLPPSRLPAVVRSDWVHNSNDSFVYTHPDLRWDMASIGPLVGDTVVRRVRTRSGLIEIPEMIARGKVSTQTIQRQLFGNRNHMAELLLPDLLAACPQAPAAAQPGCAALQAFQAYGLRNDLDAPGAPLFREFWRTASQIPGVYREPYDPARPVATPAGLKMADAATAGRVWEALAGAVVKMREAGFAPDAKLGEVQRAVFTDEPIGVHGGDEIEGVLNNVGDRIRPGVSNRGIRIDYGTSYVQTVGFDDRGPVAQALLTYGQSTDPASAHRSDQLKQFSAKQWPQLPFHPEEVERARIGPVLVLRP